MKPTIFVHTNHKQLVGALVSAYSFRRNSQYTSAFDVQILQHKDYPFFRAHEGCPFLHNGKQRVWKNDDLQSFTPLRFMPPELMGYQGRAVVVDPDVFAVGDVWELLSTDMHGRALMCVARPGHNNQAEYLASSVMLLDCAQLTDWQCEKQFAEMFAFARDYTEWIALQGEPRERIGLLDPGWNHFDTLNRETKLLHNTKRQTQPWKTGLLRDYTVRDKGWRLHLKNHVKQIKSWLWGQAAMKERYTHHPDPQQEAFFFALLRECVEQGIISTAFLHEEMRQNHLRHDTFTLLEHTPPLVAA